MNPMVRILAVVSAVLLGSCVRDQSVEHRAIPTKAPMKVMTEEEIPKNDAGWRKILTTEQFRVLREHDTEPAFTGALWDNKKEGAYRCAGCGELLFESDTKYRSGTGWPSFYAPAAAASVENTVDKSLGMVRVEVHCKRCGGHLGHVFDDRSVPTGKRYCVNSAALRFESRE